MERVDFPAHGAEEASQEASPFHALLSQGAQVAALPAPGQVVIGTLQTTPVMGSAGAALVPGLGVVGVAHSLVPLTPAQEGRGVALSVLADGSAIVLGLLWNGAGSEHSLELPDRQPEARPEGIEITVDGHREVIEAAEELELRCGEACIVLTADGRIQLRGTYITSHASATQRIVGGSVHVN
ncbi:hypothetical protein FUT87_13750 [Mitsuaria sp. TWR114]|uniref:hypothetical protein n=1 Tax=unclassified Roseateles TaxID=2626991 RepID=UPI0011BDD66C|nr:MULTISPECIES: hypothetical protein [unclassified Roseateles]MBB3281116.1 hypothetical protein [Mitsuaria sp. BK037]MBB3293179.1 hypothetical protein [Mitsuaria sp. BK041]MBB3362396.1 hypothetical protein [Mitsuaria sp. BK045]TXD86352.1 hypothetical protein FUT87_13750 [Mitsuaria sp. TWR114]